MRALVELFAVLSIKIRVVLACLIGIPLFLLRHDIYDSLMNFVLVGAIPGTHISVPYWVMLLLYAMIVINIFTYIENTIQRPLPPKE